MNLERTIGRWLQAVRAGDRYLALNDPRTAAPDAVVLTSAAFVDGAPMPRRSAGQGVGENLSPPLHWSNVPPQAKELISAIAGRVLARGKLTGTYERP
jgi:phosphatidylethanolamine-binding protein (PEBP) family uncharacterized protein